MNLPNKIAVVFVAIIAFGGSSIAQADVILDQSSFDSIPTVGGSGFVNGNNSDVYLAQTFTAGITGLLTQIDLVVSNQWATLPDKNPIFFFDIRPVAGGVPVEDDFLAYLSRPYELTDSGQTLVQFADLGIEVTPGEHLAIVLHASVEGAFQWHGGDYAFGGGAYARNVSDPSNFNFTWTGPRDFPPAYAFKTYVDCEPFPGGGPFGDCFPGPGPNPIPEPGTLTLFGIGLFGMGLARRRKKV